MKQQGYISHEEKKDTAVASRTEIRSNAGRAGQQQSIKVTRHLTYTYDLAGAVR